MEDKFKKKLTIGEFGEGFAKNFPTGDISIVMADQVPSMLTSSQDLQQKTLLVRMASGANIGMIFDIFRYDKKDEKIGTPINVNRYAINNNLELFRRWLPAQEHRITLENFFSLSKGINYPSIISFKSGTNSSKS